MHYLYLSQRRWKSVPDPRCSAPKAPVAETRGHAMDHKWWNVRRPKLTVIRVHGCPTYPNYDVMASLCRHCCRRYALEWVTFWFLAVSHIADQSQKAVARLRDNKGKERVNVRYTWSPLRKIPPQKRSGMAHVLKGSHSFTCTPTRSSVISMSRTRLAFPAVAGTHLPTPEGWKAELAWAVGYKTEH